MVRIDRSMIQNALGGIRVAIDDHNYIQNHNSNTTIVRINLPPTPRSNVPRPRSAHQYEETIQVLDRRWVCAIVSETIRSIRRLVRRIGWCLDRGGHRVVGRVVPRAHESGCQK